LTIVAGIVAGTAVATFAASTPSEVRRNDIAAASISGDTRTSVIKGYHFDGFRENSKTYRRDLVICEKVFDIKPLLGNKPGKFDIIDQQFLILHIDGDFLGKLRHIAAFSDRI
jgi:hypothetical protein